MITGDGAFKADHFCSLARYLLAWVIISIPVGLLTGQYFRRRADCAIEINARRGQSLTLPRPKETLELPETKSVRASKLLDKRSELT